MTKKLPTPLEVRTWELENGRGHGAAASHFQSLGYNVSPEDIKALFRRASPAGGAAGEPPPVDLETGKLQGKKPRRRPSRATTRKRDAVDRMLPEPRELMLQLVLQGERPGEIVRRLGVSTSTYNRWRRDPSFQAELRRLKRENRAAAAGLVEVEIENSIRKLVTLRDHRDTPPNVQRACARDILEIAGVVGPTAEPLRHEDQPVEVESERLVEYLHDKINPRDPAKEDA